MSFADLRSAIEARFQTQWGTTTPVKWQNSPFTQPPSSPWVAFWLLDGEGMQASLGSDPLHRFVGVVKVQIFCPEKTGTARARELADTAAAIFRRATFDTAAGRLVFSTPSLDNGTDPVSGWLQFTVTVPYRYDRRFGA